VFVANYETDFIQTRLTKRSDMRNPWLKPIKAMLFSFVLLILINSVTDVYFANTSLHDVSSFGFFSAIGMNLLFLLGWLISVALSFGVFMGVIEGRFSDTVSTIFVISLSFVFAYLFKLILLSWYQLEFAYQSMIIIGEILLFALPLSIAYKTLAEFGKGFKN